jgi:hypothetical protein
MTFPWTALFLYGASMLVWTFGVLAPFTEHTRLY